MSYLVVWKIKSHSLTIELPREKSLLNEVPKEVAAMLECFVETDDAGEVSSTAFLCEGVCAFGDGGLLTSAMLLRSTLVGAK